MKKNMFRLTIFMLVKVNHYIQSIQNQIFTNQFISPQVEGLNQSKHVGK